jgi:S-adenosylmethionine hydrolase
MGIKINQLKQLDMPEPVYKKTGRMEGQIIYIDRFGNLITNITKECLAKGVGGQKSDVGSKKSDTFEKTSKEKMFLKYDTMETTIGKKIVGLSKTYTDAKPGEPLVLLGSAGFLEVSINNGNAQKYFKADKGSKVIIKIG